MKTCRPILLWCVVVLMSFAAISIGCGRSSSNSTDTISMGVNRNTVFDNDTLPIACFRLTATPTEDGGYLETSTLDGKEFGDISSAFRNEVYSVLENIVILSSGSYEFTNKGALFRTKTYSGRYYELEGAVNFSTSELVLPLEYMYFRNYYNYDGSQGNDKYLVQTVLHRIPDDTVEGLGLVSGSWKIVSASLQVRSSKIDYALYDWNDDFNPNVTIIPKGDMLAWSYDTGGTSYSPLTLQFMDDRFRSTAVNLLEPLNIYDYKMISSRLPAAIPSHGAKSMSAACTTARPLRDRLNMS